MKTDTMIFAAAVAAIALLFYKAQEGSTNTSAGGAGGAPTWANTSGPMGAKYNLLTGTVEMQPLVLK